MSGPLSGIKLIELAGIGPGPFAAFMLSDMGADVIRVDRCTAVGSSSAEGTAANGLNRGRRTVAIDLRSPEGVETVLRLVETADGLMEPFRPGVTERLGVGPDACLARNERLVYGRMTGWGQDGPYGKAAGHDINYISLAGALHAIGRKGDRPVPPLNLVGDFGGGGMLLAYGMVCGLLEAKTSGKGQVVDAAMVDGTASLMMMIYSWLNMGTWVDERGINLLDSGAPYYDTYETADGRYISVGSIEPQFYALLLKHTGLESEDGLAPQTDRSGWPDLRERLTEVFKSKTRDEWCEIMETSDVCFAPVLSMTEAPSHPHNAARQTFIELEGFPQPAPAPRFSRTPGAVQRPASPPGTHTDEVLGEWLGLDASEIQTLRKSGAVA
jgi:alpha-methylacyl-CoA racemase